MAKAGRSAGGRFGTVGLVLAMVLAAPGFASAGDTGSTGTWTDARTGIAIGGYDPVAYFVNHAPRPGEGNHELDFDGRAWRFSSAANQAVFERDPTIYAPWYGGYDPFQLSRGYAMRGNPLYWLIDDSRLYLFGSPSTRLQWMDLQTSAKLKAQANWPATVYAVN